MKKSNRTTADQEPMGIVISRGPRGDLPTLLRAYMWLSIPESEEDSAATKAA